QKMGASFVVVGDASRVSALIGNAAFYAGYLVFHIFLAIWLFSTKRPVWQKAIFAVIAVYELIIINATETRGALIALFIGFFLAALLFAVTASSKKVRYFGIVVLSVLALSGALVFAFRDSDFIKSVPGMRRVAGISLKDVTTESRLLTWQASWRGFTDRPVLGYGYENFNVAFNRYFPAPIFRDAGSQIWFDRAHNIVFDVMVASGILGLGAYLSLFILSFWILWRYYKRDPDANKTTSILFFCMLLAYFIQNFFVFDTLSTYLSFYTVLAFLVFLQVQNSGAPALLESRRTRGFNPLLASGFIVALLFAAYFSVFRPARANLYVTNALLSASKGRLENLLGDYEKVVGLDTYVTEEARQKLTETLLRLRGSQSIGTEQLNQAYRYAIEEMQTAVKRAPLEIRNHMFLMALYNNLPIATVGSREEAIRLGKQVIKLSSTRPQVYFELGQAAIALGRMQEGVGYFEEAVEISPKTVEARWNLAMAYVLSGKFSESEVELKKMERYLGSISLEGIKNLLQIYLKNNRLEDTVRLYKELALRYPEDVQLRSEAATVYGKLCKVEEAKAEAGQILKLKPELSEQVQKFLSELQTQCGK
ncbi:MAG: O-antigen ligase family protein, partial [Patescibacteria group bacterium]